MLPIWLNYISIFSSGSATPATSNIRRSPRDTSTLRPLLALYCATCWCFTFTAPLLRDVISTVRPHPSRSIRTGPASSTPQLWRDLPHLSRPYLILRHVCGCYDSRADCRPAQGGTAATLGRFA
ncbi:hypothetical protein BDV37DRAFT_250729 [Aspergillus pseudonomiae]|uniref:Uncharacterized protein n=1 Tax=Aspergillus pseudonomiae TaxID=1506151 RepID=A0A5N7DA22_9EURO|nr:uncharacterized protein BDV37DRAFT_250729 [Aspergillus pseudonomiae]KAE8403316.1 hypothetical protein BDV37DRAFT_250729 [Aspergillus pseudonomiae]